MWHLVWVANLEDSQKIQKQMNKNFNNLFLHDSILFWSSIGLADKIEVMTMAGNSRTELVVATFRGGHPISLTIDYTALR